MTGACCYRWLRFARCGRRFACDLCHEEGTAGMSGAYYHRRLRLQRCHSSLDGLASIVKKPNAYWRRWLRFPCCGRRFACDLCHEEGTDGHEMKWAQRMVCGYCSKEQALGEQCNHCGKRIARSARGAIGAATHHWQVQSSPALLLLLLVVQYIHVIGVCITGRCIPLQLC